MNFLIVNILVKKGLPQINGGRDMIKEYTENCKTSCLYENFVSHLELHKKRNKSGIIGIGL